MEINPQTTASLGIADGDWLWVESPVGRLRVRARLVATQKRGLSAKAFAREMGLSSYQTAWTWLHKLRRCMVRIGRAPLSGRVEGDETYVGGEEPGLRGRWIEDKALVVIAAEEDGKGIGRVPALRTCLSKHGRDFLRQAPGPLRGCARDTRRLSSPELRATDEKPCHTVASCAPFERGAAAQRPGDLSIVAVTRAKGGSLTVNVADWPRGSVSAWA